MSIEPPAGYRLIDPAKDAPKLESDRIWCPQCEQWEDHNNDGEFTNGRIYARKLPVTHKPEWPKAITDLSGLPYTGHVLVWNGASWLSTHAVGLRTPNLPGSWTHWQPQPAAPKPSAAL